MEITFTNASLTTLCNSEKKLRGKYGPQLAAKIAQRLNELQAVDNLGAMRLLPGHCHELSQNLKGLLAISLIGKERLAFKPNHDPLPSLASGGLDWVQVTKITVVGIGDYH
ncbi:MAG TPA: hypothetical protein VHX65_08410 [Pirellulales bacterium]|jgi:proteic killer suppression protein|nr:hypothetical protein [Pirellulales bacterium]